MSNNNNPIRWKVAKQLFPDRPRPAQPSPQGSTIDIEVVIRPQPYTGLDRRLGGVCAAAGIQDNASIALALRRIADGLEPKPETNAPHCEKCGERIRNHGGYFFNGLRLCGICIDDSLNPHPNQIQRDP